MEPPVFIPGRELSRRFFHAVVQPLVAAAWPDLRYTAAHIGSGSDALGFDTEISRDHDWGPAVTLFIPEEQSNLCVAIRDHLAQQLPRAYLGYSVGFIDAPEEPGTDVPAPLDYSGPLRHRVFITTLRRFCSEQLGWDSSTPAEAADWLSFPSQRLRGIADGAIHYDTTGELAALRARLRWYPDDVWRYLLACGWKRIGQEDHLMSRAGHAGDELGSRVIGARLARDAMMLCFLCERSYAPYPKWFGTAFQRLLCAPELTPHLQALMSAETWPVREAALCTIGICLARIQNQLGLAASEDAVTQPFFSRPFQVIGADRYAARLLEAISDPSILRLTQRPLIGSIDQWSDSTDMRSNASWFQHVRSFYQ